MVTRSPEMLPDSKESLMKRFLSSLLTCVSQPRPASRLRPQPHRARLELECLEGRQLMSATPLTTLASTAPVHTAAISSQAAQPVIGSQLGTVMLRVSGDAAAPGQ